MKIEAAPHFLGSLRWGLIAVLSLCAPPALADPSITSETNDPTTFAICIDGTGIDNEASFNFGEGSDSWDYDIQVEEDNNLFDDVLIIDGTFRHVDTPHAGETPNSGGFTVNGQTGSFTEGTHVVDLTITPSDLTDAHGMHEDELMNATLTFTSNNGTNISTYTFKVGIDHVPAVPALGLPGLAVLVALLGTLGVAGGRRAEISLTHPA